MRIELFPNLPLFLMVLMRMTGAVFFNPIFGRRNIPSMIKAAFVLLLSVMAAMYIPLGEVRIDNFIELILMSAKELLVGFGIAMIMQFFLSVVIMAGEMIDMQLGVMMAKIFDPATNIQLSMTGNLFTVLIVILFFLTNGHLAFMRLLFYSFEIFPPGAAIINPRFYMYAVGLFTTVLELFMRILMPMLAIQLLTELGIGIMMKVSPQMNVFIVGIQVKFIIGMAVLMTLIPLLIPFFNGIISTMLSSVEQGLLAMR